MIQIAPADQFDLYNAALVLCRKPRLGALSDDVESRYRLDEVWFRGNGAAQYCLEQGLWNFAIRTSQLNSDPELATTFGYQFGFEKPVDWIRTAGVAQDPYFRLPLDQVTDEAGFLFADLDPLYFRYVSSDAEYGGNPGIWPETFRRWAEAYLAQEAIGSMTTDAKLIDFVFKLAEKRRDDALSKAAMNESAAFLPVGTWVRARWGRHYGGPLGDGGSGTSLIG